MNFHLTSFTKMLLIVVLLWSTNVDMCNARTNRHWKHKGSPPSSLLKKNKGYSHNNHNQHHTTKPKTKSPYHKPPPSPMPTPAPVVPAPPTTKAPPYYKGSPPKAKSPPCPTPVVDIPSPNNIFSVLDFGAKGDGNSDDTKAFEAAWTAACKVESSTMLIPTGYQFLVGPISFSGPYCQKDIVFQVDGTIIAPTGPNAWSSEPMWWMDFTKLVGLTIQGKGTIDGSGSDWWKVATYETPWDDETQMIIPLNNTMLESPPIPPINQASNKVQQVV